MSSFYKFIKRNVTYYLIYLMFIIEVLISIKSKYLVGDESFTFHLLQHNFTDIIKLTAQDVHPFLYYFIAKLFTYNIHNIMIEILVLRLVSALPYLILLIIGNTYVKNKYSKLTSKIFMLCMISMPLFADNISQIRMYGWASLFTIICYIIFIHAYYNNNIRSFILLSLFSLLSSYTHYYALLTICILYFIFLILFIINKKSLKHIIVSMIIDVILYSPWLFIIIGQLKRAAHGYWSNKLQLSDSLHIAFGVTSPVYHISVFYIFPISLILVLSMIIISKKIKKDEIFNISVINLFTPFILILFGTFISIIIGHSLLIIRYIMPAMGIFWLSISIIIGKMNKQKSIYKYLLMIIILLLILLSYIKVNKYNINSFNKTNESVDTLQKLPKDSLFIYDYSGIMYGPSVYISNNRVLKVTNADTGFPIYNKVFNNISENKDTKLPFNKNIFYIKNIDNKSIFNSKLSMKFDKKYKKKKINELYLSSDGNVEIYQILKKN